MNELHADRIKQENSQATSQKGPRNLQYNVSLNDEKEAFKKKKKKKEKKKRKKKKKGSLIWWLVVCILRAKDG